MASQHLLYRDVDSNRFKACGEELLQTVGIHPAGTPGPLSSRFLAAGCSKKSYYQHDVAQPPTVEWTKHSRTSPATSTVERFGRHCASEDLHAQATQEKNTKAESLLDQVSYIPTSTQINMKIELSAAGKREKVTKEAATKHLERWIREYEGKSEVFKVDISCLSWTQEAFDVVQPFLEKIAPGVKIGNFADIIAGLMTDEGLAVTAGLARTFANAPLIDIDLSDNAMGPRGLTRVETMIANAPLQRLYLSNCGLSAESLEQLLDWFIADNNRIARGMTDLVLDRNMTGAKGAKAVGQMLGYCTNLQRFSYLGCRTQEGTIYLANGLKNMVKASGTNGRHPLRRLELDDCNFGEDDNPAYVPLAEALQECPHLHYLDLTDAKLEIEGLTMILDALTKAGAQLTHLGLDGCGELGEEGAKILAKFLETQATTLTCFKCSYNELGDSAVPILMEPFGATRCPLKELHLECNELEKESADALVRARLPCLEKLNVTDNGELPKRYLRQKFGDILIVDEEEDAEDDEEEDTDIQSLISGLKSTKLSN